MKTINVALFCGRTSVYYDFDNNDLFIAEKLDLYNKDLYYRLLRVLYNTPLTYNMSLSSDLKCIETCDIAVFFDTSFKPYFIKYIKDRQPRCKLVFYFRNQVTDHIRPYIQSLKDIGFSLWSYNRLDCERFGFRYARQCWNNVRYGTEDKCSITYDLSFVGKDKGRAELLTRINEYCSQNGMTTFFYIITDEKLPFNKNKNNEYLTYEQYLKIAKQSNCLLDLVSSENYGLTLRPVEALFLNKKVITNFEGITKEELFSPNWVYQLENGFSGLSDFVKGNALFDTRDKIKEKYSCNGWLNEIINGVMN